MERPKLSNAYICPYCGSQDIITEYYIETRSWKVVCNNCHRQETVHLTDEKGEIEDEHANH